MITKLIIEDIPEGPKRSQNGHKNSYGHVVVIGGSLGKSGAPILASSAALRAGAGLVSVVLPKYVANAAMNIPDIMGFFAGDEYFKHSDSDAVIEFCKDKSAIAIGTGIGRDPQTALFVREIIKNSNQPIIVDAEALRMLDNDTLFYLKDRAILTPHTGEFESMINKSVNISNREKYVSDYAKNNGVYLVQKDYDTMIAIPSGDCYLSYFGTPALSKAGAGDILTGIITALVAQKYSLFDACKLGCFMHGNAAKKATLSYEEYAVTPVDIINSIGRR